MSLDPNTLETTFFRWVFAEGVGTITLDRPERKNPLTFDSYAELRDLFRALASTPEVRVVVLAGAGGNFCSGGDVHEIIGPLTKMDLQGQDDSRMVFVASVAGLKGAPYAAPYAASKHGMVGLMRSLAEEFAKSTMTVNAVCPSFVDTPMVDETVARIARVSDRDESQSRRAIEAMNKHGRLVHPDAVATMILTLCLPQSRDVNGAAIPIDGGTTA